MTENTTEIYENYKNSVILRLGRRNCKTSSIELNSANQTSRKIRSSYRLSWDTWGRVESTASVFRSQSTFLSSPHLLPSSSFSSPLLLCRKMAPVAREPGQKGVNWSNIAVGMSLQFDLLDARDFNSPFIRWYHEHGNPLISLAGSPMRNANCLCNSFSLYFSS